MSGTYLRLGVHVHAPARDVIRAALARINEPHRRDPARREARKAFYRQTLEEHRRHQELVITFRF